MDRYSINLPRPVGKLFEDVTSDLVKDGKKGTDVCVDVDIFTPTHFTVEIVSSVDGNTRLIIESPTQSTPKTVIVTRELNKDDTLTLNVLHYGLLDVEHLRALSGCAREYGCDTMSVSSEVITDVGAW